MTTRYVGSGGNDGSAGTSWATRKLTLTGVEATPVAAGDTVYVGAGTYRETLTLGVSGTAGNIITYIGDYLGKNTDGVGGVVRITGSDDDKVATRANCILNSTPRNYRTFTNFTMDTTTGSLFATGNGADHNTLQQCVFVVASGAVGVSLNGNATTTNNTIQNCVFLGNRNISAVSFAYVTAQVNNSGNLVQNCIFIGGANMIGFNRIGGITIKNCSFNFEAPAGAGSAAIVSSTALTGGQTTTVNNCIFYSCGGALYGQAGNADITENYNTFYGNTADRTNVNTGANSITYPPLFDTRPWFQMMFRPNDLQVASPFDLASYSQLVNLAGTSPTTTDLRGTAVQGAQREWGALEYDSGLKIKGKQTHARYLIGL